jgi:hypothetical protein
MLKRKITKVTSAIKEFLKSGKTSKKLLLCKECSKIEVEVAFDTAAVTCAYCVQRSVEPPKLVVQIPEGEKFPRGWALKARYVHTDGRVFEKGKETGEVVSAEAPLPKKTKEKIAKKKATKKKVAKKTPKRRK